MATYVIGDVHGCIRELCSLIDQIRPKPNDRVVFVGDLMDKGPEPAHCVEFVRTCGFEMVLGNHEEKHLRWRTHEDRRREDPSYVNPMKPLKEEERLQNEQLSEEDVAWLRTLPVVLEPEPGWVVVHGGLFPGRTLGEQVFGDRVRAGKLLRLRWLDGDGEHVPVDYDGDPGMPEDCVHWTDAYDGPSNVVYGHEAFHLWNARITRRPDGVETWGIDTGVVHGGHLTALALKDGKPDYPAVVQARARERYAEPPFPIPGPPV